MIIVFGATGNIGREVVTQLTTQGLKVKAFIHKTPPTFEMNENIQLVEGDLNQPDSIEAAMDGVEKVFLLSPAAELNLEGNAIEMAKHFNVKHIVRLSRLGASPTASYAVSRRHGQLEEQIKETGLPFTILRPSALMQSLFIYLPTIRSQGCFYSCTGQGKMSMIDTRDIAAATVKVLTEPGHEGKTYTLTGSESLSYADVAARLSTASDKSISYMDLPSQAIEQSFLGYGFPPDLVAEIIELLIDLKQGGMEIITEDLTSLTNRPARSFDQFAAEMSKHLN